MHCLPLATTNKAKMCFQKVLVAEDGQCGLEQVELSCDHKSKIADSMYWKAVQRIFPSSKFKSVGILLLKNVL